MRGLEEDVGCDQRWFAPERGDDWRVAEARSQSGASVVLGRSRATPRARRKRWARELCKPDHLDSDPQTPAKARHGGMYFGNCSNVHIYDPRVHLSGMEQGDRNPQGLRGS